MYWIAALVATRPVVGRSFPSGVLLGLCGSGVLSPPYTSWLHIETINVRNPSGAAFTSAMSPALSKERSSSRLDSDFTPAEGCGFPLLSNQPAPPPRIFTHSGREEVWVGPPTFVPMANVW